MRFHDGRIEQSGSPVSVYTSPVSTFAASFIGSYNQIPGEQFAALTGDAFDDACTVAIRPETITLTRRCPKNPDAYTLKGTVVPFSAAPPGAMCCATPFRWGR